MYRRQISLAAVTALLIAAPPVNAQDAGENAYQTIEAGGVTYRLVPVEAETPVVQPLPYASLPEAAYVSPDGAGVTWQPAPQPVAYAPYQGPAARAGLPPQPYQHYGYTPEQRAEWLEECRAVYFEEDGDGDVLGGILGAITGGIIGNAAGGSEKLGATLIGAGLGGIAGAAIGAAIDVATAGDREEEALDECEAYLDQYEAELRAPLAQPAASIQQPAYGYVPVMMVKVPIMRHEHTPECYETVEEWVDDESVEVTTRAVSTAKTVPTKAVATKYTK